MNPTATSTAEIDVLDGTWDETAWWSTSNMGEAVPGVLTPLNWTFWGSVSEHALRRAFVGFGALEKSRIAVPDDPAERIMGVFHGRLAAKVSFLGDMGDRLPGTSGAAVVEQILGSLPPDFIGRPTLRRLPVIAVRFPVAAARAGGRIRRLRPETARWWSARVGEAGSLDLEQARERFMEAIDRFDNAMWAHITCVFALVQPVYDMVHRLARMTGRPELAEQVLAGQGMHAELEMVQDLWELSRNQLSMSTFLGRHGYHGPNEGEISSRVWREQSEPVARIASSYADLPDLEGPLAVTARRSEARKAAEAALLAGLPRVHRPAAMLVLRLAARNVPLRGIGKVAFLQALDVGRAMARRIGCELAQSGVLDEPDDVAMLTVDEMLTATRAERLQDLVIARRARHDAHGRVNVPNSWRGRPSVAVATDDEPGAGGLVLTGVGACPGTVEGPARVVLDPTFTDVEPGEILVAPFTDPSWASVMFTAAALVVDIGGTLSHAAVVARELGLPCVMGTGEGTRQIATGDLCRVDGAAGTVEILRCARHGGLQGAADA